MRYKMIPGFLLSLILLVFASSCMRQADNLFEQSPALQEQSGRTILEESTSDTIIATVVKISSLPGGSTEYLFNERQARYVVPQAHPYAAAIRRLADAAFANHNPVRLISVMPGSITRLESPSAAELRKWQELRRNDLVNAESTRPFSFQGNDSLQFNSAAWQNWKAFRLCARIIPNLAKAKEIFNFCRQQLCTYGPTQIQPCIPFKYATDGCFARAHKMRYIIEQRYGYCSEKVFSYGKLYVKADLSGGCCVDWWYHVAPVIRVKVNTMELLYVIDPSMFTEPVPLLNWLYAQENTTCNASADLQEFSIQPSSAYCPSQYGIPVNSYATDPNYTDTDYSLVLYAAYGETCDNNY